MMRKLEKDLKKYFLRFLRLLLILFFQLESTNEWDHIISLMSLIKIPKTLPLWFLISLQSFSGLNKFSPWEIKCHLLRHHHVWARTRLAASTCDRGCTCVHPPCVRMKSQGWGRKLTIAMQTFNEALGGVTKPYPSLDWKRSQNCARRGKFAPPFRSGEL